MCSRHQAPGSRTSYVTKGTVGVAIDASELIIDTLRSAIETAGLRNKTTAVILVKIF